ncbi:MAG: hypothetical protein ACKV0T_04000 [Planctomycetales bacterium]
MINIVQRGSAWILTSGTRTWTGDTWQEQQSTAATFESRDDAEEYLERFRPRLERKLGAFPSPDF